MSLFIGSLSLFKNLLVAFFRNQRCRRAVYLWLFVVTTRHSVEPGPMDRSSDQTVEAHVPTRLQLLVGSKTPDRPDLTFDPESRLFAGLIIPVLGIRRQDLYDSFDDPRSGGRRHLAIDIMAPRHTPVVAVRDGIVARLGHDPGAGISVHQWDPTGQYAYMYAHLDRYEEGLKEGDPVRQGEIIGYVGSTGNAPENAPHLHFAIHEVTENGRWWGGQAVNPYPLLNQAG